MTLSFLSPQAVFARRSESSVIFAFREAEPPLVWRYDLSRDPCFTLVVREHEARAEIGFVQPGGEFSKVASFPEREQADEALFKIARVIGAPFIRWGRVLALSVVLAFSACVIVSFLSGYMSNMKYAPLLSQLAASSNQFSATSQQSSGGAAQITDPAVNGGFPSLPGMPEFPSGTADAPPRYTLGTTHQMRLSDEPVNLKTGTPVDADDVLKAPRDLP